MRNEKLPPLKLWSFMFQVIFEIVSIWRLRVKGHAPKFVIDCQSWPFKMIPKKSLVFILLGQTKGKQQFPIV
jgi:hypothetical protein